MTLIICGANDVKEVLEKRAVSAVLSIEHPGAEEGKGRAPRDLPPEIDQRVLSFYDVESGHYDYAPNREHIDEAFDFLEQHQGQSVLIHCRAGKARSVGIALGWLAYETGDVRAAINTIKAIRAQAAPNIAIIDLVDQKLGLQGALLQAVSQDPDFLENRRISNLARIAQMQKLGIDPAPEKAMYPPLEP